VKHRAAFAAALALVCAACAPVLSLDAVLADKRCASQPPHCVGSYVCEAGVCVLPSEVRALQDPALNRDGAGTSSDDAGRRAGGPAAASPRDGGPGEHAGPEDAGSDAVSSLDAPAPDVSNGAPGGPDAAETPGAGCTPVALFLDRDGDGYGSNAPQDEGFGCPGPGWATVAGDCLDAVPTSLLPAGDVHPGQGRYFANGYADSSKPGQISFDYDCSSSEDADPGNDPSRATEGCGVVSFACGENGFIPTARAGSGINALCGSEMVIACEPHDLQCVALAFSTSEPFLCR